MIDIHGSNFVRTGLLVAIGAVILLLLIRWNDYQEQQRPPADNETIHSTQVQEVPDTTSAATNSTATNVANASADVPELPIPETTQAVQTSAQLVRVLTDTMDVSIDTLGGDIVKVALLQHHTTLEENDPYILLNQTKSTTYISQSGLIGANGGTDTNEGRPVFSIDQTEFRLTSGQDTLSVDLKLQQNGVNITKRFVFTRGDYLVDVQYLIDNQSDAPWTAQFYGQIKRDDHDPSVGGGGMFAVRSFYGAAYTSPETPYDKMSFDDIADREDDIRRDFRDSSDREKARQLVEQDGGWIAMIQHYFASAWIPNAGHKNSFSVRNQGDNIYILRFIGPTNVVQPGQQTTISNYFYAGPKDVARLEQISPDLEKIVDFGWLWFLSKPLFEFLKWIHSYVGNWGWAIVILVLCMKAAFFHLSAAGFRSMAKMKKFAPKMAELKERYGDNRQKMSEEMMKLYKKEKVNPLGGCLPMLVQMPVFLALYWVLLESVELRHAPWILWIKDLSDNDPFLILPILYAGTFFLQQKLSPTPADPTQARIMQMMPFVFGFMFLFFDAGLVLYWLTNGILSIAQQYVITRQIEKADPKDSKAAT